MNSSTAFTDLAHAMREPRLLFFEDDGETPNNRLPVLLYRLHLQPGSDAATAFEQLFAGHQWHPLWRDGIFDYQHYHSNAHEALGIARGWARVMLGGRSGQTLRLVAGNALVLPAGTGHRCVECSDDFLVVGAYPNGQEDYDIQRPGKGNHAASVRRIAEVPMPAADPLGGNNGWHLG